MPIRQMRQFTRERRRVALVGVLAFAALRLAGAGAVLSLAQIAGLAFGLGLAAGLVGVAAPRLRRCTEVVALAGLAFGGLVRLLPGSALDLGAPAGNPLVVFAVWLGLIAVSRGLRRALWVLPLPRLRNRRFKARAGSRVDIHRLWYGLVPTAAQARRSGDPDLVAVEDMGLRLGRVRLVTRAAPEPRRETHLQILEVEAPFHIRFRACDGDGRGVLGTAGLSEIFLVELGPRRLVLFAHEFAEMPLGRALLTWLDDTPGRMLDRRLEMIERRAQAEDASRPGQAAHTPATPPETARDADAAPDRQDQRDGEATGLRRIS